MFSWSPFPFVRITIWFIVGLLVHKEGGFSFEQVIQIGLLSFGIFAISLRYKRRLISGFAATCLFICLGWFHQSFSDPTIDATHISHFSELSMDGFSGVIIGNEVEKASYYRYDLAIEQSIKDDSVTHLSGFVHLYLYKSDSIQLAKGDEIFVHHFFSEIPEPKNPGEFNYRQYAGKSGIYGQAFVRKSNLLVTKKGSTTGFSDFLISIRRQAKETLEKAIKQPRELQIAQALILGVKDYLDSEVKAAYSSAGAMHVLAVSGLHVGIIYFLLLFVLKPLRSAPYGSYLVFAGLLFGIWIYALITGNSPSVMRAATMFSIVSLKEVSVKRANIYNTLGLAALVILLIKPEYLFAVGFQLSFIAVFGIVHLYPMIYHAWKTENWLLDKMWSISCISIAAQLATFPLSMYYFHQFPVYFLVSNLVVIPGAMVLLILGLGTVVLGFFVPDYTFVLGFLLDHTIYYLNEAVFLINDLPYSLITGLYITQLEVWLCYGVLIFLFGGLQYRSFSGLVLASMLLLGQIGSVYHRNWQARQQRQIVFYEIADKTAIDLIDGKEAQLLVNEFTTQELELLAFQIDPYRRTVNLSSIQGNIRAWDESELIVNSHGFRLVSWQGVRLMIIDQPLVDMKYLKQFEVDILMLANDAVKNIDDVPFLDRCSQILISSDYSSPLTRRLLYQARMANLKVHSLSKDGYWLLDLNKTQIL